jgi:hypothetical protein
MDKAWHTDNVGARTVAQLIKTIEDFDSYAQVLMTVFPVAKVYQTGDCVFVEADRSHTSNPRSDFYRTIRVDEFLILLNSYPKDAKVYEWHNSGIPHSVPVLDSWYERGNGLGQVHLTTYYWGDYEG